jgi:hypothetical protein
VGFGVLRLLLGAEHRARILGVLGGCPLGPGLRFPSPSRIFFAPEWHFFADFAVKSLNGLSLGQKLLARLQNRIGDSGGFDRRFDVVGANDVRAFQDQRDLGGEGAVEAGFGRGVYAVSRQRAANE